MFNTKRTSLYSNPGKDSKKVAGMTAAAQPTQPFLKASKKPVTTTALGNGAVKLTTTGNDFVDQFGKVTQYKNPRSYAEIAADMEKLWGKNPLAALCFVFYIRMVTRVVQFFSGVKTSVTQRGQGLKHEGIFRMIWIGVNHPSTFMKNLHIFVAIGSWKDLITMLQYDLVYNSWEGRKLDWDFIGKFILAGLENPNTSELVKKYLPQIKTNSACKTVEAQADNMIGKWLCSLLFGSKGKESDASKYKKYRKLKSSGTAHQWQQLISQGKMLEINFNTIAGRALAQLVSGKFIDDNGLRTRYEAWLEKQPVAKYTGYVYELFKPFGKEHRSNTLSAFKEKTIDKQFLGLVETGKKGLKEGENGLIVVIDSSGSMTSEVAGTGVSAYSVAKSMALYFSYLLPGPFQDYFLEFSNDTILKKWDGVTPTQKYKNERSEIVAGTNFQSVADHFVKIKNSGVAEKDFPSGILCISDGCFNATGDRNKTNAKVFKEKLLKAGFSKKFVEDFKIILWDVPNHYYGNKPQTAFEDFADSKNLFHLSGLDPAVVAFITGTTHQAQLPKTSEELFDAAMDQEVLNMLEV